MSIPISVTLDRPHLHSPYAVTCKGNTYTIPLPLTSFPFTQLTEQIVFKSGYESILAVLAGSSSSFPSIGEFYQGEELINRYFDLKISMDYDGLSLMVLSDTDKLLGELDRFKFGDLLTIFKKAYNGFADKLHGKFNRRIKKYLTMSNRSQDQKNRLRQLITLLKAQSTEEEASSEEERIVKNVEKKQKNTKKEEVKNAEKKEEAKRVEKKQELKNVEKEEVKNVEKEEVKNVEKEDIKNVEKDVKNVKKEGVQMAAQKKQTVAKKQEIKKQPSPEPVDEEENDTPKKEEEILIVDDDNQEVKDDAQQIEEPQVKRKKEHANFYQEIHKEKHHKKRTHGKKEPEDNENDWQDVKQQKENKKKDKNWKKKHQKYDVESGKHHQSGKDEAIEAEAEQEPVETVKPERKPKKYQQKQHQKKNYQPRSLFGQTKEKPKKEMRVLLGIIGDSDDGWRERYRIDRVPARTEKTVKKQEKAEKKDQKKVKDSHEPITEGQQNIVSEQKLKTDSTNKQLKKIFQFPLQKKKKFILSPSTEYKLFVNNNFWIIIQSDKITIQKGDKGYIRSANYKSGEDYLLQAQDISLSLDGMCNLQDGGMPFNGPSIDDFTGSNSQFFTLKSLDIYSYQ